MGTIRSQQSARAFAGTVLWSFSPTPIPLTMDRHGQALVLSSFVEADFLLMTLSLVMISRSIESNLYGRGLPTLEPLVGLSGMVLACFLDLKLKTGISSEAGLQMKPLRWLPTPWP